MAEILEEELELAVNRALDGGGKALLAPAKVLREAHAHHEASLLIGGKRYAAFPPKAKTAAAATEGKGA